LVVPDSTTEAIDRFFDLIDNGVEKVDHVLNRTKRTEDLHQARKSKSKRGEVIEAEVKEVKETKETKKKPAQPQAPAQAIVRKPHFYIVESITPAGTIYVVTDGGNARTECSTRAFAETVLRALREATP
jgi:sRNA-binding protein